MLIFRSAITKIVPGFCAQARAERSDAARASIMCTTERDRTPASPSATPATVRQDIALHARYNLQSEFI